MATLFIDCRTVAILMMLFRLKTVTAKTFGLGSPLHLNRHTLYSFGATNLRVHGVRHFETVCKAAELYDRGFCAAIR